MSARRTRNTVLIGGIAVAAAAAAAWRFHAAPAAAVAATITPAISVTTTVATRQDVPVYAEGIGTVEAYQAVLVRPRVDGTLQEFRVQEGQDVKENDLIAIIDPRPFRASLDSANAKRQQDEARLANAKLDFYRFQTLARQDYATRQQVDTQTALIAQLNAAIAADQAAIELAQLNLSYCYILSPIPGRVGLRLLDAGNLVHATDAAGIISITQIRPISATFTLPQGELPQVQDAIAATAGMPGKSPVVLAYSSDGGSKLDQGSLTATSNVIDQTTGTITLKAAFPNVQDKLWPGQFIKARVQLTTDRNVVVVPQTAIQHGPDGLYVYIAADGGTAKFVPVQLGYQTDTMAVVTKGLSGGEQVVVSGQSRLAEGVRLAAQAVPADFAEAAP
ncbi:MAG TPA: efflux RND transporter periplasmic adaptor subunit [Acetobacteraceae bacterium]|nr:efflux RND transporter periplasmic adaptor subunit [Acetobacteraceae bacterium]